MRRRTLDMLLSGAGLVVAAVMLVGSGLGFWASSFVSGQVYDQLSAQRIYFPPAGNKAITGPEFDAIQQYAGQQLTTGAQAEAYANHFIGVHLNEVAGGKTYAEVSTAARADPTNMKLKGQVETLFRGNTLRGLLLNAYAFGTTGVLAGVVGVVLLVGALLLLVLAGLGIWHSRRVHDERGVPTSSVVDPVLV